MERDQQQQRPDDLSSGHKGRQGVDKAPGEDPAGGNSPVVNETQKGKNQVDGDPARSQDQPIEQQHI